MPGIIGAATVAAHRVLDVRVARAVSRLRHHSRLIPATLDSSDRRATLGAVDLRIVEGSGVPFSAANGSLAVVHGEIVSIPRGEDVAARVLADYRADPASLAALEGSYAIAIWDAPARALILTNDRFGLRNVYYALDGATIAFAPLVSAVLELMPAAGALDLGAVADFLTFEHVLGDATLLERVRALPPASIARFDASGFRVDRYWVPQYRTNGGAQMVEFAAELGRRLEEAVRGAMEGPRRAGIPVSGGLDSRALVAVARHGSALDAPCFTYGIPGSDDIRYGSELARVAGASHHELELKPGFIADRAAEMARLTDGMHSSLNVHAAVLQSCASWCDVLVLGNGGDCALDRLWWWSDEPANEDEYVRRMLERLRVGCSPPLAQRLFANELSAEVQAGTVRRLRNRLAAYRGASPSDAADAYNVGERHWRWVLQGIPAQATHLEFREPFYDYRVIDFAMGVPARLRAGRRLHLELIRQRAPDLARIPRQGNLPFTTSRLRTALSWRIKRARKRADALWARYRRPAPAPRLSGFADYDFELRRGSRALLDDVVLSEHTMDRGWYRPDVLREMVQDHVSGRRDHGRTLGAIATLELWLTEFADGPRHAV